MNQIIISFILALTLTSSALAEIVEEGLGIVYGNDHAFSLTAPKGWVLDTHSGVSHGVHAVFYPKESNWKASAIVAYARARPITAQIATADDAAKATVKDFQANGNPNYSGQRIRTLRTKEGKEAVIYYFSGDQWGNSEAVAYFVERKTINFIVFSSRSPTISDGALSSFEELVISYLFMGDSPMMNKEIKQ